MAKIVFCFAETGDSGEGYADGLENSANFKDDVIRVCFRGCQHSQIVDGYIFPHLDKVATKIRETFTGNKIDLGVLNEKLGSIVDWDKLSLDQVGKGVGIKELEASGICRISGSPNSGKVEIDSICLTGFSRGAVTTFAAAKKSMI
jgi:hypothetical protein